MNIKTNQEIARENNIMGWIIILMIALFIGATYQASQNLKAQNPETLEIK